ncbi:MAG: AAA family ATPase [Candidatus Aenigmarchaeota archaeon]|nr:AAA family ATPase [Candidatus Aenigmarchaeota archaeon]
MVRIIGIVSGKGGVGKTTVGLNLGAALAHHLKKNVTIVDCNVTTSHLGLYLGMYYCPITLNKVLRGEYTVEEAIQQHHTGLKVIPASLSLTDLEGIDVTEIRNSLRSIFDKNDVILLDASPGLGREAVATLRASDEILYITNPYIPFAMDIVRNQEIVNEIGVKPLGIILNMIHGKKYEMNKKEIEELTRLPVIARIPFDRNVHKSLALKVPVVTYKPNTLASREIIRLASDLIGETYEFEGALRRFLRKLRLR